MTTAAPFANDPWRNIPQHEEKKTTLGTSIIPHNHRLREESQQKSAAIQTERGIA